MRLITLPNSPVTRVRTDWHYYTRTNVATEKRKREEEDEEEKEEEKEEEEPPKKKQKTDTGSQKSNTNTTASASNNNQKSVAPKASTCHWLVSYFTIINHSIYLAPKVFKAGSEVRPL